jgi:two-component system, LuxR family, response regulator FixJ
MNPSARASPDKPRVLLVEDDAAVRRALQLLLQGGGYEVRAYRSAVGLADNPEALDSSCLVADLMMPDLDALGLLQNLRAAGWQGRAILLSGHLTDAWAAKAIEAGFDAALAKPIPDSLLLSWVARLAHSAATISPDVA